MVLTRMVLILVASIVRKYYFENVHSTYISLDLLMFMYDVQQPFMFPMKCRLPLYQISCIL